MDISGVVIRDIQTGKSGRVHHECVGAGNGMVIEGLDPSINEPRKTRPKCWTCGKLM